MQDLLKLYTQELANASDEMKLLDEQARRESVIIKRRFVAIWIVNNYLINFVGRITSTLMLLAQNYMELLVEDDVQQLRKWAEEELKKEIPEDAQKLVAAISGTKDVNNLNSFISSYSGGSSSVSIQYSPPHICLSLPDTLTSCHVNSILPSWC